MQAGFTLHIALTEPLVRCVREEDAAGRHNTANEVVRIASEALTRRDGIAGSPVGGGAGRPDHG